ncbi:MAG: ATP-binding cassette domain-containing protein [Caldicoprobacterales bacterium]|jgi:putative ABC transport system permease protein|nr:ABC transporter ATP-binding protein/permease [Clostridiales bacterium]
MLHVENISKRYTTGEMTQNALDGVTISFRKKEFAAILGPSGSGKTTFLNIIGGLDRCDKGELLINGCSTKNFGDRDWDAYRNNSIGFVFQNYNLISHLSITDNVMLGLALSGESAFKRRKKAIEVLTRVGLKDHIHKKPNQLSGGQMQRVAIARALANDPDIILADEPTGALDTNTSVQILDLIREIAGDKLVIMVTHNSTLAQAYADRIIEFRDGRVVADSNPYNLIEEEANYQLKKTSMGFGTALKLSAKNIRTKLFRTILTSFASSIGIIGIALILALSNGFDMQIATFESDTLSGFPIMITQRTEEVDMEYIMGIEDNEEVKYPDVTEIYPYDPDKDKRIHTNIFSNSYLKYIEDMNPGWINGVTYTRLVRLNLLRSDGKTATAIDSAAANMSVYPKNPNNNQPGYLETAYDLLAGSYPKDMCDLILVTDKYNRVNKAVLEELGLKSQVKSIDFNDILGLELRAIPNDVYYKQEGDLFVLNGNPKNLQQLYNSEKAITLKITGIVRPAQKTEIPVIQPGITFSDDLCRHFLEDARHSAVVKAQRKADYNVLTGEPFRTSDSIASVGAPLGMGAPPLGNPMGSPMGAGSQPVAAKKDTLLSTLGASSIPYMITIYPVDFEHKDLVLEYLDAWNENKKTEDRIVYTDLAGTITDLSGGIMRAITLVLIAFSATSLIVSLIMIGIITYISVLERTREIGVLRALGARRKDIARVFNAETFLIGAASGIIGILIASVLTIPVNNTLERLTTLENVAQLDIRHAVLLALISIILTMTGGYLPAGMAAKKDPVKALRSE